MANDYTTSTDAFADISEGSYVSSDYPAMASFVTAASRLIDGEMGRWDGFFYPTTDTKTYYYDGSGFESQDIDEFVSISAVSVAEQGGISSTDYIAWTQDVDYVLLPNNAAAKGYPYTALGIVRFNATKWGFPDLQKALQVSGIPGYSATPPDIIALATRMQAVRWFMRAKQGYQDTGANVSIGSMTFTGKLQLDPDIIALLKPIKLELSL